MLGRLGLAASNALVARGALNHGQSRSLVPQHIADQLYPTPRFVVENLDKRHLSGVGEHRQLDAAHTALLKPDYHCLQL